MFKGSFTALITPFKGGKVDEAAFVKLVEWQISGHAWAGSLRHDGDPRRCRMTSTSAS